MDPKTIALILEISQMALGLGQGLTTGEPAAIAGAGAVLVGMVNKSMAAHEALVGTPMDPASVKFEADIP